MRTVAKTLVSEQRQASSRPLVRGRHTQSKSLPLPTHSFCTPCLPVALCADILHRARGIGLRLLKAMGYKPGQGLGRAGAGRASPVPIVVLPPGVHTIFRVRVRVRVSGVAWPLAGFAIQFSLYFPSSSWYSFAIYPSPPSLSCLPLHPYIYVNKVSLWMP